MPWSSKERRTQYLQKTYETYAAEHARDCEKHWLEDEALQLRKAANKKAVIKACYEATANDPLKWQAYLLRSRTHKQRWRLANAQAAA